MPVSAGHVYVGDWAILSGYALVHQYVHIGPHCFIGPAAFVYHDVPAFITAFGSPAEPRTINREGSKTPRLQRGANLPWPIRLTNFFTVAALQLDEAIKAITKLGDDPAILAQFLNSIEKVHSRYYSLSHAWPLLTI